MSSTKQVYYQTSSLSLDDKKSFLRECLDLSYDWWVDKLDCSESFARQKVDCSFEAILDRLTKKSHFVVINRRRWGDFENREHFEVGFCSMESPIDYFLFIEIESAKMPQILAHYDLKPMH